MTARGTTPPRAFTLVEILVVIGIIGILIAILTPVLRGARGAARETVCLANMKTCHLDLQSYLSAEGEYPFMPADQWYDLSPPPAGSRLYTGSHWDHATLWPSVMHDIAPWPEHYAAWVCPGSPREPGAPWKSIEGSRLGDGRGSYALSDAFRADPRLWSPGAQADPALLRPVKPHEVRSPAAKVLFFDSEMAHLDPLATDIEKDPRPMAFADGHAAIRKRSESITPQPNLLAEGRAERLHDTPLGVRGRDF